MNLKVKKSTALLLSVIMLLGAVFSGSLLSVFAADKPDVLAEWMRSYASETKQPFMATAGAQKDEAALTTTANTPTDSTVLQGNGYTSPNWHLDEYWQIALSTKHYTNITLSASTRSTASAPRDWKITYSTTGTDFKELKTYQVTNTLTPISGIPILPSDAENAEELYIRFVVASDTNVNGGTGITGGSQNNNINNIVVTGIYSPGPNVSPDVTPDPEPGSPIPAGGEITLTAEQEGIAADEIWYKINGGPAVKYDPDIKLKFSDSDFDFSNKVTVTTYSEAAGKERSRMKVYEYSKAQAAKVSALPYDGACVAAGDSITLTAATPGAEIWYSINNSEYKLYTASIEVTGDMQYPVELKAIAKKAGYLDSIERTFNYYDEAVIYNQYYGQLHAHTDMSDGKGTITEAFKHASGVENLDYIAITDHSNRFEGQYSYEGAAGFPIGTASIDDAKGNQKWIQSKAAAVDITRDDFLGLVGYEMTWSNGFGHINTFNTPGFENRDAWPYTTAAGYEVYYNKLVSQPQSLSQFNHPGKTFGDFNNFAYYSEARDQMFNLIEVGNGEGAIGSNMYFPSYEYYTKALDKGWHLAPSNNQDNHDGNWGDSNTARTVVLAKELSEESIYEAIRNNRTYATEDNALMLNYTLNGQIMGSWLDDVPGDGKVNIHVEVSTKTLNREINRVEVIVNGGKVLATKSVASNKESLDFVLDAKYSYYYIRVTESNKHMAVSAPVWVGEAEKAGIDDLFSTTSLKVQGEPVNLSAALYNNEKTTLTIKSVTFTVGTFVYEVPADELGGIASGTAETYECNTYIPNKTGTQTVVVSVVARRGSDERTYQDEFKVKIRNPEAVGKILVDGTHNNDYVTGYYKWEMNNIKTLAASLGADLRIEEDKITKAMLDETDLLIVTAPLRRSDVRTGKGNRATGDPSPAELLDPKRFGSEFITLVSDYAKGGGTVILCAMSNYQDRRYTSGTLAGQLFRSSEQMNNILKEMGAKSIFNNDQMTDDDNHTGSATDVFRLSLNTYNTEDESASKWLNNLVEGQRYSFYSGCSVIPKGDNAQWIVKAHSTTYSQNNNSGNALGNDGTWINTPKGELYALITEQVGNGRVFLAGTVFMSDFEIKNDIVDDYKDVFSNYTIMVNIIKSVMPKMPVTPIAEVRQGVLDDEFAIEGIVTAGTEDPNAFFDAAYLQDETGGITIFPLNSGSGVLVGQKLRVEGIWDEYQGDIELRITGQYEVLSADINALSPKPLTTVQTDDYLTYGGLLAKTKGIVKKINLVSGAIASFVIDDGSGEVRVYINDYIGSSKSGYPELESFVEIGAEIEAVGLVSADGDGTRLRVRDRAEVTLISSPSTTAPTTDPSQPNSTSPSSTDPTENSSTSPSSTDPTENSSTSPSSTDPTENGSTSPSSTAEPTGSSKQPLSTVKPISYLLGDADQDEKITVKDATRVQKHVAKMQAYLLNGLALKAADADEDGKITVKDATVIQKYVAKFNLEGKPGKNIGKWFQE